MQQIKIVLVSTCSTFNIGFCKAIEADGTFKVISETADGAEAIKVCCEHKPDIAIIDVLVKGMTGFDVARELHHTCPETRTVIVSCNYYQSYLISSMRSGATGYLLKHAPTQQLIQAITMVHTGRSVYEGRPGDIEWSLYDNEETSGSDLLHKRELLVLKLVGQGLTNKEIAERLFISLRTVENHLDNIFRKLGVKSRIQATLFAVNENWFEVKELLKDQKPIEEQRPLDQQTKRIIGKKPKVSTKRVTIDTSLPDYPDLKKQMT